MFEKTPAALRQWESEPPSRGHFTPFSGSLLLPLLMASPEKDVVGVHEGSKGESAPETGDVANATNQAVRDLSILIILTGKSVHVDRG